MDDEPELSPVPSDDVIWGRFPSPFRPGALPEFVGGRFEQRRRLAEAFADAAARGGAGRAVLLVGPRGTGKTTLCDWMVRDLAWPQGWVAVAMRGDVGRSLVGQVGERELGELASESRPRTGRMLGVQASPLPGLLSLTAERTTVDLADTGGHSLLDAVHEPARELGERGSGLVVIVDEAQAADREQLGQVVQLLEDGHDRHGLPLVVMVAGTPKLDDRITSSGVGSLGMLARGDRIGLPIHQTLDETAAILAGTLDQADGRRIAQVASELVHERTGGYPHAIQVYGREAYLHSQERRILYRTDVAAIDEAAYRELVPVLQTFWAREGSRGPQPRRAQRYLRAMARLIRNGSRPTHALVCDELGIRPTDGSQDLATLKRRGVVRSDTPDGRASTLAFSIPVMARYVLEQD